MDKDPNAPIPENRERNEANESYVAVNLHHGCELTKVYGCASDFAQMKIPFIIRVPSFSVGGLFLRCLPKCFECMQQAVAVSFDCSDPEFVDVRGEGLQFGYC